MYSVVKISHFPSMYIIYNIHAVAILWVHVLPWWIEIGEEIAPVLFHEQPPALGDLQHVDLPVETLELVLRPSVLALCQLASCYTT